MNEEILTCLVCGYQSTQLYKHIRKHGLTGKEYKEKFPGSKLMLITKKSRKKMSETRRRRLTSGEIVVWNKGKHIEDVLGFEKAQECKRKNGEGHKGLTAWNKGLTKETDERVRKYGESGGRTNKGRPNLAWKDKKLEDIVGSFEKAQEIKKEQSRSRKGRYAGDKNPAKKPGVGAKISKAKMGHEVTKETRIKLRLRRIEQLTANGKKWASYNKKGCEYFKSRDESNNTHGQYAVYGGGEYLVPGLWYLLDYIDHENKKITEWDEPHHYDIYGNLKPKDVQRQREIQESLPDHSFERIKVDRNDNIIEIKLYPALNTLLKGGNQCLF